MNFVVSVKLLKSIKNSYSSPPYKGAAILIVKPWDSKKDNYFLQFAVAKCGILNIEKRFGKYVEFIFNILNKKEADKLGNKEILSLWFVKQKEFEFVGIIDPEQLNSIAVNATIEEPYAEEF